MKNTLNLLIVLLILDVAAGGVLWLGYTSMQDKKSSETELNQQLLDERQKGSKLLTLRRTMSAVEKSRVEMDKFLYDSSDESQIQFVSQIEQLGTSTTGAVVETLTLDLAADPTPHLQGSFSVKGTWGEAYHFLRLLEEFPSHLVVNRFDMKGSHNSADWSGSVAVTLSSLKNNP